jgi:membrane protease YdiL (CAAX protease family)
MSTEPTVPPRPDHLHPVPAAPPPPGEEAPRREGATWGWVEAVGVYVVAFLIAGMLSLPVLNAFDDESDLANMTATVVAALVIIGILIGWLSIYHRGWVRVMRLPDKGRWGAEILAGVLYGLGLYVVAVVFVGGILLVLLNALSGDQVQAPEQVPQGLSVVGIVVTSLYAIVIAPFGEELFFRGVLFRSLRDRHGLKIGLLGTAVGFGLIHFIPGDAVDAALLMLVMAFTGASLGFLYERRGTIVAPIAAHMTFNVIGLVLILGLQQ